MITSRWNAQGYGRIAECAGFVRPDDSDLSGMWKHEEAGDFHDSVLPGVMAIWTMRAKKLLEDEPFDYYHELAMQRMAELKAICLKAHDYGEDYENDCKLLVMAEVSGMISKAMDRLSEIV